MVKRMSDTSLYSVYFGSISGSWLSQHPEHVPWHIYRACLPYLDIWLLATTVGAFQLDVSSLSVFALINGTEVDICSMYSSILTLYV